MLLLHPDTSDQSKAGPASARGCFQHWLVHPHYNAGTIRVSGSTPFNTYCCSIRSVVKKDPFRAIVWRYHLKKTVWVVIKKWEDRGFQLVIQRSRRPDYCARRHAGTISDRPASDSLNVSSIHHPSSTLKLGMPLSAAFIPLVPDASSSGESVDHQSTPNTGDPAVHVVVFQIRDFNLILQRLLEMKDSFDPVPLPGWSWMSLAGIDQLKAPGFGSNRSQAFRISEKEICALVGSNTADKSDCSTRLGSRVRRWLHC